ncbi:hypothetical protein [Ruegeria sp. HKCCC2117]|uniref:tyrosine-type recombinase/integrase n=1 Tax=Ruegeria sp. HKCCC2117 TaxID=2682992 RepID=UPI0014879C6F|nr:hypothetical protein [Ruegeria sp. HKCCC2117]
MPKKVKIDLSDPAKRDALPIRSSYYAHPLGSKRYVLLRKGRRGATWGARVPGHPDRALGPLTALTFDQAADLVRQMDQADADQTPDDLVTIGTALDAYESAAGLTKGTRSMSTIRSHLKQMTGLRDLSIAGTKLATLNRWRDGLADGRSIATVNKMVGSLKAALNAHGVEGDWRKLKKLKEPEKGIDEQAVVLEPDHMQMILTHLSNTDPDFHDFVLALWLTGARPGEIRSAPKSAFHGTALTLVGKTGRRDIVLTPKVAEFFARRAGGAQTHLLEFDGQPVTSDAYLARWNAMTAELGDRLPAGATAYAIRHGFITTAIYQGLPIFPLARHVGTSVEMIERTYGHILAQAQTAAFEKLESVLL